uniref:Uncharacterized protein n=1 Tax=Arion vulgaris TaxID=1028688 RepID=A0A0B7B1B6_9EUPU
MNIFSLIEQNMMCTQKKNKKTIDNLLLCTQISALSHTNSDLVHMCGLDCTAEKTLHNTPNSITRSSNHLSWSTYMFIICVEDLKLHNSESIYSRVSTWPDAAIN